MNSDSPLWAGIELANSFSDKLALAFGLALAWLATPPPSPAEKIDEGGKTFFFYDGLKADKSTRRYSPFHLYLNLFVA